MAFWTISLSAEELGKPRAQRRSFVEALSSVNVRVFETSRYSATFEGDEATAGIVRRKTQQYAVVTPYSVMRTHHAV